MEYGNDISGMLELMVQPAFAVKDNLVRCVNRAAAGQLIEPGMPISQLLRTGKEEYAQLSDGELYLMVETAACLTGASVRKVQGFDLFVLEACNGSPQLQALALAARSLREPLAGAMLAADKLAHASNAETESDAAALNQRLHQLLRVIGNMSDAERYAQPGHHRLELQNIGAVLDEILEKAAVLLEQAGITVRYQPLAEEVLCPLDREILERAIYNILSNAAKNAPKGTIDIQITKKRNLLVLSFLDTGNETEASPLPTVHGRYLRQPGLEDLRSGIGLGMVMIHAAAAAHEGTVLVDKPREGGTRITLTLRILPFKNAGFHSPILRVDYTGERDHALVELSEQLPADLYKK